MEFSENELEIIKKGKEVSKYSLTKEEYSLLKRKAKELNQKLKYLKTEVSKFRGDISIEIYASFEALEVRETILRSILSGSSLRTKYKESVDAEFEIIKGVVGLFETVFQERDSMTDYAGLYRIGSVLIYRLSNEAYVKLESIIQKARSLPSYVESSGESVSSIEIDELLAKMI